MKKAIIALFGAAVFLLTAHNSRAGDAYYIEIGKESSEEEALLQWQAYSEKYADTLGGLQFHPVTVLHQDSNQVGTRIQAGPLPAKLDAYRLCGRFIDDKVPCFIVEGAEKKKGENTSYNGQQQAILPWLQSQQQVSEEVPLEITEAVESNDDSDSGFFSWIFGDDEDEQSGNKQPVTNKKGEVEVAEAINVPVTADAKPMYTARPVFEHTSKPDPVPAPAIISPAKSMAEASTSTDSGVWLTVKTFADNEKASAFWQAVRASDPIQTAGYRVKIVRPFTDSGEDNVSLNIGPFADNADARNLCHTVIQSKNAGLRCDIAVGESRLPESKLVSPRFEHGKRYERRRQALQNRYNRREAGLLSEQNRTKVYWVQVAVAENQMDALKSWDDLREQHPDLLEGLRSSVSATLMKGSKYMVRVGPLESGSAATELCTNLTGRGVPCRIYSNM
ncbi:MAG: SPOR domain-containing protein [Alphaproteobacteria bacterium]